jgi:hypothetical protein
MLQNTSFQAFRLSFTIRFRKRKVLCRLVTLFAAFLLIPETAASQSSSPREKVHLHLDKSVYAAGDTIWFKAYTVLAGTNELSATSKVLHADLYASSGTRIARLLLPLRSGLSNGDIALPDTLKEGRYRLRAYTSWMRNFGDSSFFEKDIQLINGLGTASQQTVQQASFSRAADVQFFPEGGDMVAGIRSRVGVKVTGAAGRGLSAEGSISDQHGNTVTTFKTTYAGMGTFVFMPEKGKTYKASVTLQNQSVQERALPVHKENGYALAVNNMEKDTIYMSINQSEALPLAALLVTASNNANEYFSASILPKRYKTAIKIPRNQLAEGVTRITLWTKERSPIAERLLFNQRQDKLKLKISRLEADGLAADSTTIRLEAFNEENKPELGSFSMAVVKAGDLPYLEEDELSISASLLLTSELQGNIEHPNYYFIAQNGRDSVEHAAQLDNLMLTQGWRRFKKGATLSYTAEKNLKITGRLQTNKGTPIGNTKVRLFAATSGEPLLMDTITNAQGHFEFNDLEFYGSLKYMVQVPSVKNKFNVKVLIDSAENVAAPVFTSYSKDTLKNLQPAAAERFKQIARERSARAAILLNEVAIKTEKPVYSSSGGMRKLSDRIIGEDALKHVGSLVEAIERSGTLIKWNKEGRAEYTGMRTVLAKTNGFDIVIDGSNYSDNELLRSIDPKSVESIEIFLNGGVSGTGDRGAIVVNTKLKNPYADMASIKVAGVETFSSRGYNEAREFYIPKSQAAAGASALRDVLYWNPYLTPDASGTVLQKFYQSNRAEKIRITIEGITVDGRTGRAVYESGKDL